MLKEFTQLRLLFTSELDLLLLTILDKQGHQLMHISTDTNCGPCSSIMSNNANSSQKRGAGAGSTSDVDTVIPLLFAANPGIAPNYKKMSAMDSHGRTAVALEHKFRKWRAAAREILAAHPEEAGTDKVVGEPAKAKKPRVSKATNGHKKTVNDERAQKDDDDGPGETKTKASDTQENCVLR